MVLVYISNLIANSPNTYEHNKNNFNDTKINSTIYSSRTSLVAQLVKKPPAMRETWVQSLGWEDPLQKGKATHSNILA